MNEVWTVKNYDAEFGPFPSRDEAEGWAARIGEGRSLLWHPIIYREGATPTSACR